MRKRLSLSDKIPQTSLFIPFIIFVPILIFSLTKNILLSLLFLGILIFIYIHSGKLKTYDGQIIFVFGLPRSGKTMFLAKIAHDNIKNKYIVVNEELEHFKEKNAVIERADIGKYQFGNEKKSAIILYDEISLDGFDNRDFKKNFSGPDGQEILAGFKKSGHRYQSIILANQGYNEVDAKIRQGLTHSAYWVKNKGWYSVAIKLRKNIEIDNLTGEPRDTYIKPSLLTRLIDPSCYIYIPHKKYGKFFNTLHDKNIPFYNYDEAH